ncbi:energy transducer TonB [Christiangramia sp. SM2212]|uniref:Energy transducer TonB n=1 Tax=Christiangramia sediminicola TaxID=3073267 RepID=A0ABU1ELJ7_9FLAO|nr:energy transducer TonB [Christiangramia sp. SM2212]MDR5589260.1 energy transducer TonB [Christiangramia sp. SM2212]
MKTFIKYYALAITLILTSFQGISQEKDSKSELDTYPFAVADQVPAFPGCEQLSGKAMKDCTVEKITNHVNKNFNTALGKQLKIEGTTRIVVQFKIDKDGSITEVRSRSLADKANVRETLQTEANRVVSSLPKMQPGQKDGKDIAIMYSLPIAFAVPEEDKKENKKG